MGVCVDSVHVRAHVKHSLRFIIQCKYFFCWSISSLCGHVCAYCVCVCMCAYCDRACGATAKKKEVRDPGFAFRSTVCTRVVPAGPFFLFSESDRHRGITFNFCRSFQKSNTLYRRYQSCKRRDLSLHRNWIRAMCNVRRERKNMQFHIKSFVDYSE